MPKNRTRTKRRRWFVAAPCLFLAAWATVSAIVGGTTRNYIYTDPNQLADEPVAIVFGAGLLPNGEPSLVLRNRLDGAIELRRLGKVSQLLMSGDNRVKGHNEPEAMRRYAVSHGVADRDIRLDFAGRDTYDTCYRARNLFACHRAILVTQAYHAPRAVYIARGLGIAATAYAQPNLDRYPGLQFVYGAREYLADLKAVWDVNVSHRKPYVR